MNALAKQVGVKTFFTRRPQGVEPTIEAINLYNNVKPLIEAIDFAEQQVTDFNKNSSGVIRMRCPPQCAEIIMKPIEKFITNYPCIKFEISTDLTNESLELLRNEKLDLIISYRNLNYPDFKYFELKKYTHSFFATESFMAKYNISNEITLPQLKTLPTLATKRVLTRKRFEILEGFDPIISVPSFEMIFNGVINDVGIGFATNEYIDKQKNYEDIVKIKINNIELPSTYLSCSYNVKRLSKATQMFLKYLKNYR
ncbi:MAG: LysR family transcriptional regulator [Firmicutes bacterium]|nr:LysR family transcriptional regulator [Bacillota bacterium]